MTALLPNLYTNPSDIMAWIGSEGLDTRLAETPGSGQTVTVVSPGANEGDVTVPVVALQLPLLARTVLRFSQGAVEDVVTVILTAVAQVGDQSLSVDALEGDLPATASAQDNGVNVVLAQRATRACQYATAQIKDYCCPRYDDSQLKANADSKGSVNRWATALAAKWLAKRMFRSCPEGLVGDAKEALEELRQVRRGMLSVADIPTRNIGVPFMDNMTVDPRYNIIKARFQPQISDATPTLFPQYPDWDSVYSISGWW